MKSSIYEFVVDRELVDIIAKAKGVKPLHTNKKRKPASTLMSEEAGIEHYTRLYGGIWRYNSKYRVFCSSEGLIASRKAKTGVIRTNTRLHGYSQFRKTTAHKVIWETFFGPIPEGFEIDHINEIRHDNRLDNLKLLTHKENAQKRDRFGSYWQDKKGAAHPISKPVCQYDGDKLIATYVSRSEAAKAVGGWQPEISKAIKEQTRYKGYFWRNKE